MHIQPITQKEATAYVGRLHRHHRPPRGSLFQIGLVSSGQIVGVSIVGRPISRMLQDGFTCEVIRMCTDGTGNACSMLYGASWRAARALGYRRIFTYTLPSEGGASLRGAGWICDGDAGGGSHHRESRPRVDKAPTCVKTRWRQQTSAYTAGEQRLRIAIESEPALLQASLF